MKRWTGRIRTSFLALACCLASAIPAQGADDPAGDELRQLRERNILWPRDEKRNGALNAKKETHGQEEDEEEAKNIPFPGRNSGKIDAAQISSVRADKTRCMPSAKRLQHAGPENPKRQRAARLYPLISSI